jgi:hypothetical protein
MGKYATVIALLVGLSNSAFARDDGRYANDPLKTWFDNLTSSNAGIICVIPLAYWYAAIYVPGDTQTWGTFMRIHPVLLFSGPLSAIARTFGETLPAALAAAVFAGAIIVRGGSRYRPSFPVALACYAFSASVFVLLWPGGSTPRYYFPMVVPLCVFGSLGYDLLSQKRPEVVATTMVLTAVLLSYALIHALGSPLMPLRYQHARVDAQRIITIMQTNPGPIYKTGDTGLNILPYVPGKILIATPDELANVKGPGWMLLPNDQANALAARRPSSLHVVIAVGDAGQWRLLRFD